MVLHKPLVARKGIVHFKGQGARVPEWLPTLGSSYNLTRTVVLRISAICSLDSTRFFACKLRSMHTASYKFFCWFLLACTCFVEFPKP